ncbi:hypothetical protein Tco_1007952 [Tanacetum coccineum]
MPSYHMSIIKVPSDILKSLESIRIGSLISRNPKRTKLLGLHPIEAEVIGRTRGSGQTIGKKARCHQRAVPYVIVLFELNKNATS